ncbi:hypothetical protein JZ751_015988 [Albula glossodonta]|uniref:phospholipase A2 n=1 Tax=Albula glossodonta TaxID=121402 RepID=A0A8T2NQB5_9TELE|nr:hypothetical protein JZ751_015988 [Albula glossodonta]
MLNRKTLCAAIFLLYRLAALDNAAAHSDSTDFCYWRSSTAQGRSQHNFLRLSGDAQAGSLRLYHSIWTEDRRLVDCAVTTQSTIVESYLSLCRGAQAENFTDVPDTNFASLFMGLGSQCIHSFESGEGAYKRDKREINSPSNAEHHSVEDSSGRKLRRQKRSWIIPGTVWCGSGNKATNYDELGVFGQTDKCCREHDHCSDTIPAFNYGYGIFNRHIFTVSHCDCDNRFHQCLLAANTTVSNMVGYGYFNLLKTPCFILTQKMQCSETNWFGMCTLSQMSPFAIIQDPTDYNSTVPLSEDVQSGGASIPAVTAGDSNITLWTVSNQNFSSPAARPSHTQVLWPRPRWPCRHRKKGLARGNTFKHKKGRGLKRRVCVEQETPPTPHSTPLTLLSNPSASNSTPPMLHSTPSVSNYTPPMLNSTHSAPNPTHPMPNPTPSASNSTPPMRHSTPSVSNSSAVGKAAGEHSGALPWPRSDHSSENALPAAHHSTQPKVLYNQPAPVEDNWQKDKLQPCDCYKHLDECRLKIPPGETRFGLQNLEHKTLYHCNCTHRLAQQFPGQGESNAVRSLLAHFVSLSCFSMPSPNDCPGSQRCSAVLSETPYLQLNLPEWDNRYKNAPNLKVRRHNTRRRSKRRQGTVQLYRKCLKIMDSKS